MVCTALTHLCHPAEDRQCPLSAPMQNRSRFVFVTRRASAEQSDAVCGMTIERPPAYFALYFGFRVRSPLEQPAPLGLPLMGADESASHTSTLLVRVLSRMMSDGAELSNVIACTISRVRSHQAYGNHERDAIAMFFIRYSLVVTNSAII